MKLFKNSQITGIFYITFSLLLYSISDGLIKHFFVSTNFSVAQITVIRALTRLLPIILIIFYDYYKTSYNGFKTNHIWLHTANAMVGSVRTFGFIYAYSVLPLAECSALGYTSSIIFVILAVIFLDEVLKFHHIVAMLLSTIAIIIALRPGLDNIMRFATIFALAGSAAAAISKLLIKKLTKDDNVSTIAFYSNSFLILIALPFLYNQWITPNGKELLLFLVVGLSAGIAQMSYALSLKYATALNIAPYDYSYFVFIIIVDYLFNNSLPSFISLFASLLIIIGNAIILLYQYRQKNENKKF
jgi:drug/metabolite transporter (DMT)-like permease